MIRGQRSAELKEWNPALAARAHERDNVAATI